jgi:sulfite exporter TauE/SafE
MSIGLVVSAWLVGALAARDASHASPLLPARTIALRHAAYHAGRIATYAILGALFGAAGATLLGALDVLPLQRVIYVAANGLLLLLGASLVVRLPVVQPVQRLGLRAFAPLLQALQPMLRRPGVAGRVSLGLTWGLMPCALIYGVLPLALLSGGAWQGGVVMLAFGLGTLPNLLATGVLLVRARRFVSGDGLRRVGAIMMIGFGLAGIGRVFLAPDTLAQGAFCLLP